MYRKDLKKKAISFLAEEKYKFLNNIGEGSYGYVIAVRDRDKKSKLAAKIIPLAKSSLGEILAWPKLDHENVLPLVSVFRKGEFDIYLMPLHPNTLKNTLKECCFRKSRGSFDLTKRWLLNISDGLEYLHSRDVCHLDLKADNILISSQKTAIICDFTCLSRIHDRYKQYELIYLQKIFYY